MEDTIELGDLVHTPFGQPHEIREPQKFEKIVASSNKQGFDASAETVGTYDPSFQPKTVSAVEGTFKSSATAQPALVSIQSGVSYPSHLDK